MSQPREAEIGGEDAQAAERREAADTDVGGWQDAGESLTELSTLRLIGGLDPVDTVHHVTNCRAAVANARLVEVGMVVQHEGIIATCLTDAVIHSTRLK